MCDVSGQGSHALPLPVIRGERVRSGRVVLLDRMAIPTRYPAAANELRQLSDEGRCRIAVAALLIFQKLQQMPARLHALVQYAHNLNHIR